MEGRMFKETEVIFLADNVKSDLIRLRELDKRYRSSSCKYHSKANNI